MASKKEFLSIVTATALAASFTMTGCGSSSSGGDENASSSMSSTPGSSSESSSSSSMSSSESNSSSSMSSSESNSSSSMSSSESNSSSSSVAPGVTMVRVSDAYVIGAVVKAAGGLEAIEVGNGEYEFNTTDVRSGLVSTGGVNDMNGNGAPDAGEPLAPSMKAPIAYTNINPFTTKVVDQEENLSVQYPTAYSIPGDDNLTFNFDVVAKGAENIDLAKEAAKAALSISGYMGDGTTSSSSDANSSSSMISSSAGSSSSIVFPAAGRSPFPETSSSSDANSSSSSSEASSSESGSGDDAYARIDNCLDTACVNAVVAEYMAQLNGTYQPVSSSEASSSEAASSSSEEVSSSSEAASSSDESNPFPAIQR